jgi:hypothetical protein
VGIIIGVFVAEHVYMLMEFHTCVAGLGTKNYVHSEKSITKVCLAI